MLLLVSVQNVKEAHQAIKGGADIVDVKNLQEALVGSAHPNTFKEVKKIAPDPIHSSLTLGVVPDQIGTVAMAVHAAGLLEATSVKVGFMHDEYDHALETLLACRDALEGSNTLLIGSLFADNLLYDNGLNPSLMVDLAVEGKCDGFLIDTLVKDGRNLFDFMPENELKEMVIEAKSRGLSTALSGHLKLSDLDELARINPDIVGVRGAVCAEGDRDEGVYWEAVKHFKDQLDLRKSGELKVRENLSSEFQTSSKFFPKGEVIIDGQGKSCSGIIAALAEQIKNDNNSIVEVIIPDELNTYDVLLWARNDNHSIIDQQKDGNGNLRILLKP
jgi:uncharacterized protein (UPF0264 family)/TusA-related sulfurtransferase|tara:strand:+ start:340 stop:1332 length:993 start_codon:yes stop_codon:yes gene_type:complete